MSIDVHVPTVNDFGGAPFAEHDQACAVCWVNKAVLELHLGVFSPCWSCQRDGWRLKRKRFMRAAVPSEEQGEPT